MEVDTERAPKTSPSKRRAAAWGNEDRSTPSKGLAYVPSDRVLVVFDGDKWRVRKVACIEYDVEADQMIYRCDLPVVNGAPSCWEAFELLKEADGGNDERDWKTINAETHTRPQR